MKINQIGIDLIKQFEGLVDGDPNTPGLDPYICPTGNVTIGYGHVIRGPDGVPLRGKDALVRARELQKAITPEEAEALLAQDLEFFEAEVIRLTSGIPLNENQFSALVSFVFNLGATKFQRSTLRKLLKEGDFTKASQEFSKWVKGDINNDGVLESLPGLVRRREAERQLFIREVKPLTKSRTILGAAGTIASTAGLVVAEVATELSRTNEALAATGTEIDILKYILAGVTILSSIFVIYARVDDRRKKGH